MNSAVDIAPDNQAELSFSRIGIEEAGNVFALQCMAHPPSLHEPETLFSRILTAERGVALALHVDGKFAGYALGYAVTRGRNDFQDGPRLDYDRGVLYLHDMALLPRMQGNGYGAALYNAFEGEAAYKGYTHIIANAIEGRGGFWAQQGFTEIGTTNYRGVQAMRMEKDLQGDALSDGTDEDEGSADQEAQVYTALEDEMDNNNQENDN